MADTGQKTCGTVETNGSWTVFTTTALNSSDGTDCTSALGTSYGTGAETSDYTFGIPGGSTIDGIEILCEFAVSGSFKTAYIRLSLSWNDGSSWTSTKEDSVFGATDTNRTYGGSTDDWGRTWAASDFNNGNFRVKYEGKTDANFRYVCLDYSWVKVYYTAAAGDINEHHGVGWANVGSIHGVSKANINKLHDVDAIAAKDDEWVRDGYLWRKAA